jgi:dipeptidase D
MKVLEHLTPNIVWNYFEDICSIPHGSGNMEAISNYCVDFAKAHNLAYRQDENYNIIIWKSATKGYENAPTVILQGHMDMVAVKEADCTLDLEKDGLQLETEGDFVSAKGTTLGGDDGIAIAYALAILASDEIEHPALEAVFTVDEEIGLLGASSIDTSDLKGRMLLNLDSEEEGIFLTSCAGGVRVDCKLPFAPKSKVEGNVYQINITGLLGGHSGAEIHKERANANVLLGRVLFELCENSEVEFKLSEVFGGEKDNAIATFAHAKVVVPVEGFYAFENALKELEETIKAEYQFQDPNICIEAKRLEEDSLEVFSVNDEMRIILELVHLPHGVQKMSTEIEGMVETSLNLGILSTNEECVELNYSVRSSITSEKDYLVKKLVSLTELLGGECEISGDYPGWAYQKESTLRDYMVAAYEKLFGTTPKLEGIHAGVECGLFASKLEGLDCISIGPQMYDIHTVKERLSISSVERTWKLILETLKTIQ